MKQTRDQMEVVRLTEVASDGLRFGTHRQGPPRPPARCARPLWTAWVSPALLLAPPQSPMSRRPILEPSGPLASCPLPPQVEPRTCACRSSGSPCHCRLDWRVSPREGGLPGVPALTSPTFPPSCVHPMDFPTSVARRSLRALHPAATDQAVSPSGGPGRSVRERPGWFQWAVSGSLGLPPSTEALFSVTRPPPTPLFGAKQAQKWPAPCPGSEGSTGE